jgi:hypothetical protein
MVHHLSQSSPENRDSQSVQFIYECAIMLYKDIPSTGQTEFMITSFVVLWNLISESTKAFSLSILFNMQIIEK